MNVVMTFAAENFDFSTAEGRLHFHILAVFADWYVENLAREVRKGKISRVRKGLHNNQLPFGYVKGPDGVGQVVPEEAEIIRRAYELYATGEYTDRRIAEFLNQAGFRTRRNRPWSKDSVRELLQNEFYLGLVKHRGDLYPGLHEPIISRDLFDRVQEIRRAHAQRPRLCSPTVRVYLLSGLARCAHCGRTLRAQGGPRYSYYREMSKIRGFADCPMAGRSIRMEEAEAQLARLMMAFTLPPDWREEIRQALEDEDQRKAVLVERQRLREKLRRVGELYADGIYSRAEYEAAREEIERRLELLVLPDPGRTIHAGYHLETLAEVWPLATRADQKELCRLMLRAVYFDLERQQMVRVVPEEDFLPLFRYNPYLEEDGEGGYRVHLPEDQEG
ncbi:MAG TPA: hypothetical protein G4O00_13485 [Thermoflexia bacterium]|nr:hypothetical protein [Thermoflexia bacterium]